MCGVLLFEVLQNGKAMHTHHLQAWICIDCLAEASDSGEGAWEAGDGDERNSFPHHIPQLFPFEFCTIYIFLTCAIYFLMRLTN